MRIVYCIETFTARGGIERIVADKMNWLSQHTNHEVVLLTIWHDNKELPFSLNSRIRRVHLNVPYHLYPLALLRFNNKMLELNPGVAIMFRAVGAFLAAFTTWKGKMIYESHTPLEAMNHKWVYPLMMKRLEMAVCLTEGDSRNFGKAKNVLVIPNYCTLAEPEEWPNYGNKRVVCLGRECWEKDFERLDRLWRKVQEQHTDWQLDVHHNTQDVTGAYMSGSIYVMTSRFEGFPMVLVESMTCGLPVVALDCNYGPREIIEDGRTGYLIPYDDDEMFVRKLAYLMDNKGERERMGHEARNRVRRYDRQKVMRQWLQILAAIQRNG